MDNKIEQRLREVSDTNIIIISQDKIGSHNNIPDVLALIDNELGDTVSNYYRTFLRKQKVIKQLQLKKGLTGKYDNKEKQIYLYLDNIQALSKHLNIDYDMTLMCAFLHELGIAYMDDEKARSTTDFSTYEIEQILADLFMLNYLNTLGGNDDLINKIASTPSLVLYHEGLGLEICDEWLNGKNLIKECKASRREFLMKLYDGKFDNALWHKSIKKPG